MAAEERLDSKYLLSSSDPTSPRKRSRSAHIVVCWLALLLIRIAERGSGQSWRRIATELRRLHLVTLHGAAGTAQQTTQPSDAERSILVALEVEPPPRITALEPA